MFKRVSSLVLAVLMVLTMVGSMTAFAAAAELEITVAVNKIEAEQGEEVIFTYYADSTKAWASLEFETAYEPSLLTLQAVTDGADAGVSDYNDVGGVIKMAVINNADVSGKTVVATITFKVNANVAPNTDATVSAVAKIAGAPNPADKLNVNTAPANAVVRVTCLHKNGTVVPNGATTHAVNCPTCGNATENCNFAVDKGTVTNVAHGQYTYKVWGCTRCTNTQKENLNLVAHKADGVKALGNKTHQIICKADGYVVKTEACTFSDTTGCQVTCDKCKAVYTNSNLANAIHANAKEHYYAPVNGAQGKITEECVVCGYAKTLKTGTWAFADVAKGAWFYDAITFNKAYGLFNGTSDTQFSPDDTITRGQAATVLSRMLIATINEAAGSTVITEAKLNSMSQKEISDFVDAYLDPVFGLKKVAKIPAFTDVPMGEYFGGHVRLMATLGIINGKTATTFVPNDNVTRQELAKLMEGMVEKVEAINNGKKYTSFGTPAAPFTDVATAWGKSHIEWARTTGLMNGMDGTAFAPDGTATRAQVATLMMRLKRTVGEMTTHNMGA